MCCWNRILAKILTFLSLWGGQFLTRIFFSTQHTIILYFSASFINHGATWLTAIGKGSDDPRARPCSLTTFLYVPLPFQLATKGTSVRVSKANCRISIGLHDKQCGGVLPPENSPVNTTLWPENELPFVLDCVCFPPACYRDQPVLAKTFANSLFRKKKALVF